MCVIGHDMSVLMKSTLPEDGAPGTFLVDGAGIVRWKHVGPLTDAVVADELKPALQQIEAAR